MREVYEGVKALILADTVFQGAFIADVGSTVPQMPYVVLWGPGAAESSERSLDAADAAYDFQFWVKSVAGTGEAVLLAADKVKTLLHRRVFTLTGGTHKAELVFKDTNPIQVDRDVVTPNTNRHPCFVDMRFHAWVSPISS